MLSRTILILIFEARLQTTISPPPWRHIFTSFAAPLYKVHPQTLISSLALFFSVCLPNIFSFSFASPSIIFAKQCYFYRKMPDNLCISHQIMSRTWPAATSLELLSLFAGCIHKTSQWRQRIPELLLRSGIVDYKNSSQQNEKHHNNNRRRSSCL